MLRIPKCRRFFVVISTRLTTIPPVRGRKSVVTYRAFSTTQLRGADILVKVPQMAESIAEGTLASFLKQVGERVEADDEIATIETDKIDVAINSPEGGVIKEIFVSEGDTVTVGQDVARIEIAEEASSTASPKTTQKEEPESEEAMGDSARLTTTTKEEHQHQHQHQQAEKQTEQSSSGRSSPRTAPQTEAPRPVRTLQHYSQGGQQFASEQPSRAENRVKMSRMRLRIAERLKQSQNEAASLTTFNEVDMSAIINLRKKYKDQVLDKHGVRLGFMGAFTKASALALRDFPAVNASIEGGDTIVFRDYMDISIAVSSPKGLVTPVIRNCETMNIVTIEKNISDMAAKARDSRITLEDMAGGNFTISNGGVFGSLMGMPIINLPQTAVLGLQGIKERPVVVDGNIVIRPMMYLSLTYDHRLLDGREAVCFLVAVKDYMENPASMLLD